MYIYIYVYMYMYTCIYTCIHIYINILNTAISTNSMVAGTTFTELASSASTSRRGSGTWCSKDSGKDSSKDSSILQHWLARLDAGPASGLVRFS